MKVILTEEIKNLGDAGTIQEVKNGYARNYLLPRGLAKLATPGQIKQVEQQQAAEQRKVAKAEEENRSLAGLIEQQTIRLTARVGQGGRLYGSITSTQIAEQLSQLIGQTVDRRKVEIDEPIHSVGEYQVPVRLVGKLIPKVKVIVEPEGEPEAAPATETAAPEVVADDADTVEA